MQKPLKVEFLPGELQTVSDENLFTLLRDLQEATEQVMLEGWRRKLHTQLAEYAMSFQAVSFQEVKGNGKIQ